MNKGDLQVLITSGKTLAQIAQLYNLKSSSTVRHWMKKYNIAPNKRGVKRTTIYLEVNGIQYKHCKKCNTNKPLSDFHARKRREGQVMSYCIQCANVQSAQNLAQRTAQIKKFLVDHTGNACNKCKKQFDIQQYDFHHTEPAHKDFQLSRSLRYTVAQVVKEIQKCILLCANCHAHTHHINKQTDGYENKIKGNTELWNANKRRKLRHIGKTCCEKCGYDEYDGALAIVFPETYKHYRKYNKTHWDEDFKLALSQASVLCANCIRMN